MTQLFEERLNSFERRFSHEQEIHFKIKAVATRMMALWTADKLGLTPKDFETYADAMLEMEMKHKGFECVIDKIHADLTDKGLAHPKDEIAKIFQEKVSLARHHLSFQVH